MKRRFTTAVLAVLALGAWLGISGALGRALEPLRGSEATVGLAVSPPSRLPVAWHRSSARLVPELLMPREVASAGNFPLVVGGGGNCDREPVASIRRMSAGDALVSFQEYVVTRKMRGHLRDAFVARGELRLGAMTRAAGAPAGEPATYYATIPFREGTRAFDALVYAKGRPDAALRRQIDAVLGRLRIAPADLPNA